MQKITKYHLEKLTASAPNIWDIVIIVLIFGVLAAIAWGASQMATPYHFGSQIPISLAPENLPGYALSTVIRMFIALIFSLLFTFSIAPLAAKNKHAERFLLPFIDIMQSIPVLGMLSISVMGFVYLFPNSRLGPECAAIFAIFTAQVWNMVLSLYQSLKTVPKDLVEAADMYRLSAWQRFWRVEVPFGTPGLLWNTMMSMSAGWFFVVLSEAISIANNNITLPGIGSYISKAILEMNIEAMVLAIITMLFVILLYDQLIFRPLLSWAEKFQPAIDEEQEVQESWFYDVLTRTKLIKKLDILFDQFVDFFINKISIWLTREEKPYTKSEPKINIFHTIKNKLSGFYVWIWYVFLILALTLACFTIVNTIYNNISLSEIIYVFYLGLITALKVIILIIIASIIWVPIGAWIGLSPRAKSVFQPLIQFLAAFPANFFYPIAVIAILKYGLNKHIWTTPLMILGTQWYILFNVIVGASSIPKEIKLAAKNFGVKGSLWWKKLMLPAIFPYYATGAMAAAGGCWNASIVAEFVQWGDTTLISLGLGSYIEEYTRSGDFPRVVLGITIMCLYVIVFNRLLWQRLYDMAEKRFSIN